VPQARFQEIEQQAVAPCPCCGNQGNRRIRLVTEKGRTAWDGCEFCLNLAMRRGQEPTLAALCRAADQDQRPQKNVGSLLGG
jgi:hypothetical protein